MTSQETWVRTQFQERPNIVLDTIPFKHLQFVPYRFSPVINGESAFLPLGLLKGIIEQYKVGRWPIRIAEVPQQIVEVPSLGAIQSWVGRPGFTFERLLQDGHDLFDVFVVGFQLQDPQEGFRRRSRLAYACAGQAEVVVEVRVCS